MLSTTWKEIDKTDKLALTIVSVGVPGGSMLLPRGTTFSRAFLSMAGNVYVSPNLVRMDTVPNSGLRELSAVFMP
jgi:hypothetical protein